MAVQDASFGQVVGGPRSNYSYSLYMETRAKGEVFKVYKKGGKCVRIVVSMQKYARRGLVCRKYTKRGIIMPENCAGCGYARSMQKHCLCDCMVCDVSGLNLKVIVIDVSSREVRNPVFIRAEQGWRVAELKMEIAEVRGV